MNNPYVPMEDPATMALAGTGAMGAGPSSGDKGAPLSGSDPQYANYNPNDYNASDYNQYYNSQVRGAAPLPGWVALAWGVPARPGARVKALHEYSWARGEVVL